MRDCLLLLILLCISQPAFATRTVNKHYENLQIKPGETVLVSISANAPTRLHWNLVGGKCDVPCIEAVKVTGLNPGPILNPHIGANYEFQPTAGKISIEFSTLSNKPINIEVFSEDLVCDAEACALLASKGIAYPYDYSSIELAWKRFRSQKLHSYEESTDGSYARVKGQTAFGKEYEVTIIWWLIDDPRPSGCKKWIPKKGNYVEGKKKIYQFSGSYTTAPAIGFLLDVGCSSMKTGPRDKNDF